jgi:uncharacterized protein YjaG (DUF416 family)
VGEFDRSVVASQLSELSTDKQIAFAAACCERLAPTFALVCELGGAGDPQAGQRLLQVLWDVAGGDRRDASALLALRDEVDAILPEEDDEIGDGYPYASEFQDALYNALEGVADGNPDAFAWAAESAHTVAFSIAQTEIDMDPLDMGPGLDAAHASAPVQQELARQGIDLAELSASPAGSVPVGDLRVRARADGEALAEAVRAILEDE